MTNSRDLLAAGIVRDIGWTLDNPSIPPYGKFSVSAQDLNPTGVFFKPDGLKMYVLGFDGDNVSEYNLATAWDIYTASFVQSRSVSVESTPQGVFFKPDGLKMYVVGSGRDAVDEYNLATGWDVSTASFLQSFSVAVQDTNPTDIFFKPDGLKMYVIGSTGDAVYEYNLATAWDVSTASFLQSFSVAVQDTTPTGVFFKPDGLKMYVIGSTGDAVYEYNLATAWDVSTASFLQSFSVITEDISPQGVFFKPDGLKMYVLGNLQDAVHEYNLATAWDISTASWILPAGAYFSVAAQDGSPRDIFFKPDGLKMYVVGSGNDRLFEYNLATAWDVSTASFLQSFNIANEETFPHGVFFKPDGLKMYVIGSAGDDVNEYNLATAWDISTASFLRVSSVAAQETFPTGVFFRDDGLKMYVIGTTGDDVNEYNLASAWDISTKSFVQSFSVFAQAPSANGVSFKPNGRKMYVICGTSSAAHEYNLATAWDISTASFVQSLSVINEDSNVQGFFFKPDGQVMYITGVNSVAVWAYSLI